MAKHRQARVPSVAPAARVRPCTIVKCIAYRHRGWILKRYVLQEVCGRVCSTRQGEEGGHCKSHHLHCENFFASFSTCAQSVPPRIQSRVPLPPSCASGTMHLMSSTLGHGQSMGLLTHTSVSWQRYSEQETVIKIKVRWKENVDTTRVTSARTTVCVHCPLLLAGWLVLLLRVSKHSIEKLELGTCKCE